MKWGVRHDKPSVAIKKRRMKKYGISEKEHDEVKDAAKKKSGPLKAVSTIGGGLMGAITGQGIRTSKALKEGHKAFTEASRQNIARGAQTLHETILYERSPNNLTYLTNSPIGNANAARNAAISRSLSSPLSIATLPISAAVGSAIGYTGGRILEEVIASNMMSEVGLRRDNRTYNNLREYDVRLKRD